VKYFDEYICQILHDIWPSPGLVHYIYIFTFLRAVAPLPLAELWPVQNSLCVQVLRSPILAALLQGTPAAVIGQTAAWYKEWNY